MIFEKYSDNIIVLAYDEWNRKDLSPDNYYVLGYLEFFPTRINAHYRKASYKSYRSFYSHRQIDKEGNCNFLTVNEDCYYCDSHLYYPSHLILDWFIKKIANYDIAYLPYKRRMPSDLSEEIRTKHLAKTFNKHFNKLYQEFLDKVDMAYNMAQYDNLFYSTSGPAYYYTFFYNNDVVVPDHYLGTDMKKYRGAVIAFMHFCLSNVNQRFSRFTSPIGESKTSVIDPLKWNWRKYLFDNDNDHITKGTHKFLDNIPGCIPLGYKISWNTSHVPSRIYYIAHNALARKLSHWQHRIDDPQGAIQILEKSTDDQIRKALKIFGVNNFRNTKPLYNTLLDIFDYPPLSYDCTLSGWATHSKNAHEEENLRTIEEKLSRYEDIDEIAPEFPLNFEKYGLKQLRTPKEIILEGHEMKHCVGGYVQQAIKGASILFSGEYEDYRATIEINQFGEIVQVRGVRNHQNMATNYFSKLLSKEIEKAIDNGTYVPKKKLSGDRKILDLDAIPF